MEKENRAFFNSPVTPKNTPIKRLGLSRKRKSSGFESSPVAKVQACHEHYITLSEEYHKPHSPVLKESIVINYDEKIELLKKEIVENEEKLKNLQLNIKNIKELEDLIEVWKNGCKNAFMHFIMLLKEKQSEDINQKAILLKLGIWETMVENFENDTELSLLD